MGKPILLLRLEGPLQSWGTCSRWGVRDTAPEPTKSGIIGLLGCALGYAMSDPGLEALNDSLRFGVRVENPGRVLVDYQTITDFLPTAKGTYRHNGVRTSASLQGLRSNPDVSPATILSPRAYLEDGAFLAAFEQADSTGEMLQKCAGALRHPKWPLFLGRKACAPTRPIYEAITDIYSGLEDAMRRHPWSWLGSAATLRRARQRPPLLDAFIEVSDDASGLNISLRQDAIRTNAARVYGFRSVKHLRVDFPSEQEGI
jgi:CRISPR system Cascade subunit CasD